MNQETEHARRLPADRAFVVQFLATAEVAAGRLEGRVEHVVSGQATHFASVEGPAGVHGARAAPAAPRGLRAPPAARRAGRARCSALALVLNRRLKMGGGKGAR